MRLPTRVDPGKRGDTDVTGLLYVGGQGLTLVSSRADDLATDGSGTKAMNNEKDAIHLTNGLPKKAFRLIMVLKNSVAFRVTVCFMLTGFVLLCIFLTTAAVCIQKITSNPYSDRVEHFKSLASGWSDYVDDLATIATTLAVSGDGASYTSFSVVTNQAISKYSQITDDIAESDLPTNDFIHAVDFLDSATTVRLPNGECDDDNEWKSQYTHRVAVRSGSTVLTDELDTVRFITRNWSSRLDAHGVYVRPVACDEGDSSAVVRCKQLCANQYGGTYTGDGCDLDFCHSLKEIESPIVLQLNGDNELTGDSMKEAGIYDSDAISSYVNRTLFLTALCESPTPTDSADDLEIIVRHSKDPWAYYESLGCTFGSETDSVWSILLIFFIAMTALLIPIFSTFPCFMLGGLAIGEWRSRRYAKRIEHAQPLYAFTDGNPLRSAFDDVGSVLDAEVMDLVEDKGTYVSLHELSR
ncbi:hypothetical protein J8273_2505 [Carpediemonas membranifera]|uniref:Uncharacterized protein n=1 Tax=Carpediemonas membranifera TaxID=201153 RepID=A0A8J6B5L4_9EUKA|nr:hypothetical protein J8273_2505 [Carpediemonas membranifera]|eukprot:KAG9396153.1 hypothetical protein J8273_2505 [Carpediemonas membranifera]